MFKRKNRIIKAFWIICFLVFSGICANIISKSFTNYFSYETVTNVETIYENPAPFPTVSICNQNPFMTNYSFEYAKSVLESNNISDLFEFLSQNFSDAMMHLRYGVGANLRSLNISDKVRKSMGLLIDDMLLNCVYNNQHCSVNDFVWYFDSLYG